ncbi:hypothetical protein EVAR_78728_1 [Eumeta japonica]|uniref:Uncharacterized protein n=1 Tax=Eumeta variegata TaxID=151549 RepID=A0A4C1T173_EUMVA|nr:hypothetical protein EVAR_78728_1 [Eumeta japonica]
MCELRNDNWQDLMEDYSPFHQAYWRLTEALKSDTVATTPPLLRNSLPPVFDDIEKAECLADNLQNQYTENLWKEADVIDIPKSGKPQFNSFNYRSVSFLNPLDSDNSITCAIANSFSSPQANAAGPFFILYRRTRKCRSRIHRPSTLDSHFQTPNTKHPRRPRYHQRRHKPREAKVPKEEHDFLIDQRGERK